MLKASLFIITVWSIGAYVGGALAQEPLPSTCFRVPCSKGYKCDPPHCVPVNESVCASPKEVGPCLALIPRYYYNSETRLCERFSWGGCQPNGNNFVHLKECVHTCKGSAGACHQPKRVGPCRAMLPRYFYNRASKQCELFYWGGCQPNDNNFSTLEQCQNRCES